MYIAVARCVLLTLNTNPKPKPYTVIITEFSVVFRQNLMYIGAVVCFIWTSVNSTGNSKH